MNKLLTNSCLNNSKVAISIPYSRKRHISILKESVVFFQNNFDDGKNRLSFLSLQCRKNSNVTEKQKDTKDAINADNTKPPIESKSFFTLSKQTKNQINAIKDQAKSIPNIITITRICSTPILCSLIIDEKYKVAVVGCFFAGFSDWLDGYIAKNYKQQTVLGTYLDPLADKILINSIAVSLSYVDLLPWWSSTLWLGRDVLLVGMSYRMAAIAAKGRGHAVADPSRTPLKVSPTTISKVNTLFQFGTIGVALGLGATDEIGYYLSLDGMNFGLIESLSYATAGTTILSGLSYIDGKSMIGSGNSKKKI